MANDGAARIREATTPSLAEGGPPFDHGVMSVEQWQRVAVWVAGVSIALGLGASTGCAVVPKGPPSFAWLLHPLVMALGALGGYATVLRKREIDRRRWEVVQDDLLTSGERQWAHREAERDIRMAGTVFLLAAVGFGYWMAYQFNVEDQVTVADFLIVTPLLGFVIGLLFGLRGGESGGDDG